MEEPAIQLTAATATTIARTAKMVKNRFLLTTEPPRLKVANFFAVSSTLYLSLESWQLFCLLLIAPGE
jgi:hypothetical protein